MEHLFIRLCFWGNKKNFLPGFIFIPDDSEGESHLVFRLSRCSTDSDSSIKTLIRIRLVVCSDAGNLSFFLWMPLMSALSAFEQHWFLVSACSAGDRENECNPSPSCCTPPAFNANHNVLLCRCMNLMGAILTFHSLCAFDGSVHSSTGGFIFILKSFVEGVAQITTLSCLPPV